MHDTYFWNLKVSSFNPSLLFHGYWKYFRDIASEGWYARVCIRSAREGVIDTDEQAWKRRSIKAWSMTTWFCTVRIYKWWLACLKYGLSKSILFWNTGLKNQKFPFENIFSHNIISSRVNNRCWKGTRRGNPHDKTTIIIITISRIFNRGKNLQKEYIFSAFEWKFQFFENSKERQNFGRNSGWLSRILADLKLSWASRSSRGFRPCLRSRFSYCSSRDHAGCCTARHRLATTSTEEEVNDTVGIDHFCRWCTDAANDTRG